jgi:phosphatidylglycerol---prolipoprotein diacylglyceryl transferase
MVIATDPILMALGPFTISWAGLMITFGVGVGLIVAIREARRRNLADDVTAACAFWGGIGGILGARLLHVINRLDFYLQNPDLILGLQPGGLTIWGGIIGGFATGAVYARRRGLSLKSMADVFAPAILSGLIIGRIGSIINGEAFGVSSSMPWAFVYLHPNSLVPRLGVPTEPYPLYEMVWNGVLFGILWRLRRQSRPAGTTFLTFMIGYAVGRFFLTFARQEQVWFLGLQGAQVIAVVAITLSMIGLFEMSRRGRNVPDEIGLSTRAH